MATTKVSALTSKATLTGTEEILINDGGTSKKSTVAAVTATNTAAIALNTAKTGITSGQASEITANTAKVGITTSQANEITANTAKVGITSGQASAITANTAKTGITSGQASAIVANTAKTGITSGQASEITANTAKTGITSGQASAITANTAKVTNATHTGDVTGATALTIAAGAVDIAMLSAGGTAGGTTYLRGDNQWATVASGNITTSGLYEMANIIASNYSIASGNNAISAGPITINTGIAVTVPSGSTWVIA